MKQMIQLPPPLAPMKQLRRTLSAFSTASLAVLAAGWLQPAAALAPVATFVQDSFYVDPVTGVDAVPTSGGTEGDITAPFRTIQFAINEAFRDGVVDTVELLPGVYSAASGETFPILVELPATGAPASEKFLTIRSHPLVSGGSLPPTAGLPAALINSGTTTGPAVIIRSDEVRLEGVDIAANNGVGLRIAQQNSMGNFAEISQVSIRAQRNALAVPSGEDINISNSRLESFFEPSLLPSGVAGFTALAATSPACILLNAPGQVRFSLDSSYVYGGGAGILLTPNVTGMRVDLLTSAIADAVVGILDASNAGPQELDIRKCVVANNNSPVTGFGAGLASLNGLTVARIFDSVWASNGNFGDFWSTVFAIFLNNVFQDSEASITAAASSAGASIQFTDAVAVMAGPTSRDFRLLPASQGMSGGGVLGGVAGLDLENFSLNFLGGGPIESAGIGPYPEYLDYTYITDELRLGAPFTLNTIGKQPIFDFNDPNLIIDEDVVAIFFRSDFDVMTGGFVLPTNLIDASTYASMIVGWSFFSPSDNGLASFSGVNTPNPALAGVQFNIGSVIFSIANNMVEARLASNLFGSTNGF